MSLASDIEATAANAVLPGSGILVKLYSVLKPILPWLALAAGIASLLWAIERHGEAKGRAAEAAKLQPKLEQALQAEQVAAVSIGRLRSALDDQNASILAAKQAQDTAIAASAKLAADGRARAARDADTIAALRASAAKPIAGSPCAPSAKAQELWK